MKRYKLLKDLPFAKAGTVFEKLSDDIDEVRIENEPGTLAVRLQMILSNWMKDKDWFEEIIEETESRWEPRDGEPYCYITDEGLVSQGDLKHEGLYRFGNCFEEYEEALEASKLVEFVLKLWHWWKAKRMKPEIRVVLIESLLKWFLTKDTRHDIQEIYNSVYSKDK